MQYRREIDGLRAVAVLPVIFFHAGVFGFSGGFIGVDIFFVISGYLITTILVEENRNNKYSIMAFYERRARRLLPALFSVLAVTTILAVILMPPDLLELYSQSLVSVTAFSSNIFFYLTSDYFSTAAEEKPLLHTWSLAVEEQFYVIFPILISIFWFLGKKGLTLMFVGLAVASFLFCQYLLVIDSTEANFYLIFSRAWELLAGSIIAMINFSKLNVEKKLGGVLALLGLGLLVYAVVTFDETTPFPSFYTLIPVVGTLLVIVFTDCENIAGKFLSNKLLVGVGLISYSLYLWHQPLLAFVRLKTPGSLNPSHTALVIVLTFILAYVSYKFIEEPFRNKHFLSRKKIFSLSGFILFSFTLIGIGGYISEGGGERFRNTELALTVPFISPKRGECHTQGVDYVKPEKACRYFGEDLRWASFGDSHTVEPAYALAKLLEERNIGLLHLSFSGCPPALLFEVERAGCTNWIRESLEYLESNTQIENVLLGFRYTAFLFGDHKKRFPELPNENPAAKLSAPYSDYTSIEVRALYWESLVEIITRLVDSGKKVYLLYPIPELPVHVSKAATPFSIFHSKPSMDLQKITKISYYQNRHAYILEKLDTLEYGKNLIPINPLDELCSKAFCSAHIGQTPLYFDDNHITVDAAEKIVRGFISDGDTGP